MPEAAADAAVLESDDPFPSPNPNSFEIALKPLDNIPEPFLDPPSSESFSPSSSDSRFVSSAVSLSGANLFCSSFRISETSLSSSPRVELVPVAAVDDCGDP